jgi:hypothetical protein
LSRAKDEPQRLGSVLGRLGSQLGLTGAIETGRIWSHWVEIVGRPIAEHAEPTSLKQGVLRIRTDSPTWATELGYRGSQIARRANDVAGREVVTEVRVWTGPGPIRYATGPPAQAAAPTDQGSSEGATRTPAEDPIAAFRRARTAWARRRAGARSHGSGEGAPRPSIRPGEKP